MKTLKAKANTWGKIHMQKPRNLNCIPHGYCRRNHLWTYVHQHLKTLPKSTATSVLGVRKTKKQAKASNFKDYVGEGLTTLLHLPPQESGHFEELVEMQKP